MRLDFNVLWIEDQPDRVAAQSKKIASEMANEGFEFRPRACKSIDDVEKVIADNVFTDEVDLILVDWDLGNNMHGEDAIEKIRRIIQYKDVVFYSGQLSASQLRQKVYERQLEGVYCVGREDLIEEVIGVFESLIKKVLDIDHTRGIVMGATSDIDHIINTCLQLAHGKMSDQGKATFVSHAVRRIEDKVKDVVAKAEALRGTPTVDALLEAHMVFTSDDRLRLLINTLKMREFANHAAAVETLKLYRQGVQGKRNILGHAVLEPKGKPTGVANAAGNVVGLEEMRELRKQILGLRAEFRALLDAIQN
ncbi:hypothetical protein MW290_28075 [Aquincola tertiaricarbonis]|uniref:Uncharacterized protein n=1 Tax=Aquincola tertiaricarbonis TaxID=391953 RepID=A0ABY4SDP9_AQUTE|nr:hypothetical protein [Aquincola tertiaricarbonis]URI09425.1 hypothetical protein MW290_28075 [Aquincola tertiaricarbonis]